MQKISRRSLIDLGLRGVAGAGLLRAMPGSGMLTETGSGLLAAAQWQPRSLVCIHCYGGGDDNVLAAPHRLRAALADLQPLYDQNVLAVIGEVYRPERMRTLDGSPGEVMAKTYSTLRFLPHGFATLEWAARAANVDRISGEGAYTFDTGVSMVAPGLRVPGAGYENPAIRRLTAALPALRTAFPQSVLGRQLEDVSRLIRIGSRLGGADQIFFIGTSGMSRDAATAGLVAARHRELAQAMAAFFAATVEFGRDSDVLTYTDGEFTDRSGDRGTRLVLGGSVIGGRACRMRRISQDSYAGTIASSFGVRHTELRERFPEFEPTMSAMMA